MESKTFEKIVNKFNLKNKKVLDIGCGEGDFMFSFGRGSVGVTTTQAEVEKGLEKKLNIVFGNAELVDELNLSKDFEVIWANNFFEHILSPHFFLIRLKRLSKEKSILILGVPVVPKFNFLLNIDKFRGALASNHINFFDKKTLELTVKRAGWKIKEARSFVFNNVFLDKIFSLFFSPHIYIVSENDVNFKYPEKKIKEWEGDSYYKNLLNL
jgi:2-polyprenyl-3-methyl-5-hydroxy-6-metoxy-1,4-benzoquinol methylase